MPTDHEKEAAAIRQLGKCARAACGECELNVEDWKECIQTIRTCEGILCDAFGIEREEEDGAEGTEEDED